MYTFHFHSHSDPFIRAHSIKWTFTEEQGIMPNF